MKTKNEIGNYLKKLREENLMTQTDFAKVLNVEPQTISKWETGAGYPDISLLEQIAIYYKIQLDDIFECKLPEYRNTKTMIEQNIVWKNNVLKALIMNGVEPIHTKPLIEKNPKLVDYQLDETESLKSFLLKTQNKMWSFDEENLIFVDPQSGYNLENGIFKVFVLINMTPIVKQSYKFLVKNFDLLFSDELLVYLAKHNYLNHNLISYMAFDEGFAKKANVGKSDMTNLLHPQFSAMNDYNIEYQGEQILPKASGFYDMVKEYETYSFEQVKKILDSYQLNTQEISVKSKALIRNLKLDNIHLSLLLLSAHIQLSEEYFLKYIESAIKMRHKNSLNQLVELYRSLDFDVNPLHDICFKNDDLEMIVYLIDTCGVFTNKREILKKYANYKNLADNDINIVLIEKTAKLELLISEQKRQIIALENKI